MWMPVRAITLLAAALSVPAPVLSAPGASFVHRVEFEDEQIRVLRLVVPAGDKGATVEHLDGVLVFLTRDLQGRMPVAEASWLPAGTLALDNSGPGSFEALLVELKGNPSRSESGLSPEASPTAYYGLRNGSSADGVAPYEIRVVRLIENPRAIVTKQRFGPTARVDLVHFHARDNLFVYLSRGEVAGATARWGRHRVERGQVDVLPPNVLHVFSNMGSDPIEFITVHPR